MKALFAIGRFPVKVSQMVQANSVQLRVLVLTSIVTIGGGFFNFFVG
jgi:hypothetical protein